MTYQYITDYNREVLIASLESKTAAWGDCMLWLGTVHSKTGYGVISVPNGSRETKTQARVHRLSWELAAGERVPEGMTLDHLCHTEAHDCAGGKECLHRRCINPEHLEPVTNSENASRVWRKLHDNPPQFCKNGHEFTSENTKVVARGTRTCIMCSRGYWRKYDLKRNRG